MFSFFSHEATSKEPNWPSAAPTPSTKRCRPAPQAFDRVEFGA